MKKDMILQTIAKQLVRNGRTCVRQGAHCSSLRGTLRTMLLLLLMMTTGVSTAWGAFTEGLYYIKSNANAAYYLCPSIGCYYRNNVDQPHLTTFKTDGDQYSIWKIVPVENETDTYYIIHYKTGRYLKSNENFTTVESNQTKSNRKAVHLEIKPETLTDDEDDEFKFLIKNNSSPYQIYPKVYWNKDVANMSFNPTNEHKDCYAPEDGAIANGGARGMIGLYLKTDNFSKWQIISVASASTPCATPIIKYDGDNINISYPYNDENGITIYYTTDGSDPSSGLSNSSTNFNISASGVVKVRAIATKTGLVDSDEAVLWGSARPFLIQSKECADYYVVPSGNGTNVNTSSIPGSSMQWTLQNAGASTGGVQYYYVVNSNSKTINYNSSDNTLTLNNESADANKFCVVENGYGTGYFFLIPVSQTDKVLYKNSGNIDAANCKAELNKKWDTNLDQWKLRECNSDADQKSLFENPPFTLCNDINGTYYYEIVCLGTNGEKDSYIVPSATYAGISTTETDRRNKSWMFAKASDDDWQNYYYIVSAATGKYMCFQGETSSTAALENAVTLENQPIPDDDHYQFLLARAINDKTSDDTYYIIPKTHKNNINDTKYYYYGFWNNNNQVQATLSRAASARNVKWIFQPNTTDMFCLDPVAKQDNDGNVSLECPTIGAEIHYTDNGDTPTSGSGTFDPSTPWSPTDQVIIKAIAVLKNNTSITSENTITVLNNPDITLSQDTYTYDKTAHEPGITEVSYGGTTASSSEYSAPPSSYTDNINAGTANVTLEDVPGDNMYICNASKTFTINPAELEIVVNAMSKGYGDDDPVLTYTCSGIVEGDEISDVMTGALAREAGEAKGTYAINQGTVVSNSNYTIATFTGNDLTIEPKSLGSGFTPATGITIDDITKIGSAFSTPAIKHNNTSLTLGTDYDDPITITGDATTKYYNVTFTGIGNYTGSVTVRFANVNFGTKDNTDYTATFVTNSSGDSDFAKPADITPYIITGVDGDGTTLVAEELDYIPENVPVVLMTSSSATNGFSVKVRSGGDVAATGDNKLLVATGSDAERTFAAGEIYILYNGEFVLNAAGTLAVGKVYLPKSAITGSAPAPARLLIRSRSGLSSIKDAYFSPLTTPHSNWYTLDGRRLIGKPTRKGLYLQNGQKVVVK